MFGDVGPFEGRKPLIPGYMFVSQDTWPIADGVVGFVGLVAVPDLDQFVAAIRADRAQKRTAGVLQAYVENGVLEFLGRRLHLRGGSLVEAH